MCILTLPEHLESTDNEIRLNNYKAAEKKTLAFNNRNRQKNNIKNAAICILCASLALWHGWTDNNYDRILGFCLLKLKYLCIFFFFLSRISIWVKPSSVTAAGPVVAMLIEYYIGNSWSDPQHLRGMKSINFSNEIVSHLNLTDEIPYRKHLHRFLHTNC